MKYLLLGTAFAVVLAAGSALLVSSFTLEPASAEVAKDCTWSEVKDCYSGSSSPTNPCCAPKVMEVQIAKTCTWSDLKLCYSGLPIPPTNTCCAPKVQMEQVARNCTWGELKVCYSGAPIPPTNTCCPPKVQMDNPIG